MFKLITKATHWKAISNALMQLSEEAVIEISELGLHSFTMDASHTEALEFDWKRETFSHYEVELGEMDNIKINIPTNQLAAVFKRFSNDEEITVTPYQNQIIITNGIKKFNVTTMFIEVNDNKKPKIPYEDKFDFELAKLEEMIDDCRVFGIEVCYFESKEGKLNYSGNDSSGNVQGVMMEEYAAVLERIGFNFTYMGPVLKSLKLYSNPTITCEVFPKAPIRLTFNVADVISFSYYLAPVIPTDPINAA